MRDTNPAYPAQPIDGVPWEGSVPREPDREFRWLVAFGLGVLIGSAMTSLLMGWLVLHLR